MTMATTTLHDYMTIIGNEYVSSYPDPMKGGKQPNALDVFRSLLVQEMGGGLPLLNEDGERPDGRIGISLLHHQDADDNTHEIVVLLDGERICDRSGRIPVFDERVIDRVFKKAKGEVASAIVRRAARHHGYYSSLTNLTVHAHPYSEQAACVVIRLTDALTSEEQRGTAA